MKTSLPILLKNHMKKASRRKPLKYESLSYTFTTWFVCGL